MLGKTYAPPKGWNSFDSYGGTLNEKQFYDNLEIFKSNFLPFGYEYFVIDASWYAICEDALDEKTKKMKVNNGVHNLGTVKDFSMDEFGRYTPAYTYFPKGFNSLAKDVKAAGAKFGVHIMRGIPRKAVELNLPVYGTKYKAADIANTQDVCDWCNYNYGIDMDKPGAQDYYDSFVSLIASWGVDFIKVDDITEHPEEINAIVKAVEKCGRDIVLSLSPGGDTNKAYMDFYQKANMLRVTSDIWDRRKDIEKAFEAWEKYVGYEKEDFWIDLDMIPFGYLSVWKPKELAGQVEICEELGGKGFARKSYLTKDQQLTFITMRALAASPLFIGGDLPTMDEFSTSLLVNKEMLECNQNGVMGKQSYKKDGIEAWITFKKGDKRQGWLGIFNRTNEIKKIAINVSEILPDFSKSNFYDVWESKMIKLEDDYLCKEILADSVCFIKFN